MYTVLTSAIKNFGDFLIAERGKSLLKTYGKEKEFLEYKRWESLDSKMTEINETKAIILCGGPGYQTNFYPDIFRLVKNLNNIKIPVIPLGLGWRGYPTYHPENFHFDASSKTLLQYIHNNCIESSCRDNITREILNRYDCKNVVMTGCPAWYDINSIGKKFEQPKYINRIAVSMTPTPIFLQQNIELLQQLRNLLKPSYPKVELFAVFHRGIAEDEFTIAKDGKYLQRLASYAEETGYKVIDASYSTANMDLYRECDFHVGFRIHAHIFFLSLRKPTFLLWVDGRGRALSETLGLPDVPLELKSTNPTALIRIKSNLPSKLLRILGKIEIVRRINQSTASDTSLNQNAVNSVLKDIEKQLMNGFQRFQGVDTKLDNYFKEMVRFLQNLP